MIQDTTYNKLIFSTVLTILFVGVIITGGIIASQKTQQELSDNLIEDYQYQETQLAQTIAKSLQSEIQSIREKLFLIAKMPEIQNARTDECNKKLGEVFETLERKIGNLGRVNKDGIFACSVNTALIGTNASSLGTYIDDIFNDPEHAPVTSHIIKPPGITGYAVAIHVPVFNSKQEFIGTIGGAIYIDELQKKYFKDIRLTTNGHVVLLDDNGIILYHPYSELVNKNFNSSEFRAYADSQVYQNILDAAKAGEVKTERYIFDKEEKIGAFASVEVLPGRKWVILVTTPTKDIEQKLITLRISTLFKSFIGINSIIIILAAAFFMFFNIKSMRELIQFNNKLRQLDKLKDEFVSIASHELRTPLTAIRGLISMILEGDYGKVPESLKPPLKDVESSANRLITLVNDLLDMTRIEAGRTKLRLTDVRLDTVINETIASLQPLTKQKGIGLTSSRLPAVLVQADKDKLQEILHNIIGNAIKFTDSGSIIVTGKKQKEYMDVFIKDTGIGITADNKNKLFGKFQQVSDQKAGRPAGTGLGLYISRELIRKMGGDVWIEQSEIGKGTTFGIRIPFANSPQAVTIKKQLEMDENVHPQKK